MLFSISELITNKIYINKVYNDYIRNIKKDETEAHFGHSYHNYQFVDKPIRETYLLKKILDLGFAVENKTGDRSEIIIQERIKDTLNKFLSYASKRGEEKKTPPAYCYY